MIKTTCRPSGQKFRIYMIRRVRKIPALFQRGENGNGNIFRQKINYTIFNDKKQFNRFKKNIFQNITGCNIISISLTNLA